MKKIILSLSLLSLLTACGDSGEKKETGTKEETVSAPAAPDITQDPAYQKGLSLVAKSDCLTCHKVDEPLTGPTYRDVANKYAGMPDTIVTHLAGKIIKGGAGVWGQTFMTPHPALSQEDAEAMVRYILLLKK
ncbi:MAG TPA: c-type cytochrome [Chitinophagaceae bacterium]|nr:c-type cytochrome [Chitinophagaceae bacterium]